MVYIPADVSLACMWKNMSRKMGISLPKENVQYKLKMIKEVGRSLDQIRETTYREECSKKKAGKVSQRNKDTIKLAKLMIMTETLY